MIPLPQQEKKIPLPSELIFPPSYFRNILTKFFNIPVVLRIHYGKVHPAVSFPFALQQHLTTCFPRMKKNQLKINSPTLPCMGSQAVLFHLIVILHGSSYTLQIMKIFENLQAGLRAKLCNKNKAHKIMEDYFSMQLRLIFTKINRTSLLSHTF